MKKHLLSFFILFLFTSYQLGAQCNPPAALDCESAPVLCSLDELDGYSCANPDISNPTGPSPLCFGTGVPHNTNWWAFVGDGNFLTMVFDFDPTDCTGQGTGCSGIQVGILDNCGGDPLDCNANCNVSTLTLSGQTLNCHTYYVWIDGCCGDVCNYTIDVAGGGPPLLPRPLPPPMLVGRACPCGIAEVCVEDLAQECDARKQWTIDGIDNPDFDDLNCLEFEIEEGGAPVEICVTFTIGNPANPDAICDQESSCFTLIPEPVEVRYEPERQICWEDHQGGGYVWRGDTTIYTSCIDPPCRKRELDGECCVDYEAVIELLPPRPIGEVYKFFCDKTELPLITEDGQVWFKEACGEDITWQDPNFYNCDTTYILYMSFFDPEVTLEQECGRCDGFVTLRSEVEYFPECINGNVTWLGYWLNESLDTIGAGEELMVTEEGTYYYVMHVTYVDNFTGEVQECDLEGLPPWLIVVKDFGIPAPELDGLSPICEAAVGNYEILNTFLDACEYNWYIKRGGGQIITPNYLDSTEIRVEWVNLIGGIGEVCVNVTSDCSNSEETCFEVEFKAAPDPDAGPDVALCAKDYKMRGTEDVAGGSWTIIKSPGTVNIDIQDITSNVSVDLYGEYIFVWTENILTCDGDDTVKIIFNSNPEAGPVDTICGGDAEDYRVFFKIFKGTSPYTIVQGGGMIVNTNEYQSDTILDNMDYNLVIQDKYGCEFTYDINHDCVCPNEIGTVSADTLKECGPTTVSIDYNPTNMVLGPDDVLEFVLYTTYGSIFTTDIQINKTGTFTFDPNTMNYGQVYHMGVVLGKNRGDEFVNRLGGCVKVAEGQPVIWYEIPTPDAGPDFEACATKVDLLATQSIAGSTIKWLNTSGALIATPDQVNTSVTVTNFGRYVFRFTELNAICPSIDSVVVIFHESPDISGLEKTCIDQNVTFEWTYEVLVGKGQGPYILISGKGTLDPNTGTFTSQRLKSLERDTVIIEDVNGCRDTLPLVHNCDCGLTNAGTMNTQLEQVCLDQCVTVVTNNDHGLESDDCVFMVLHPDSSNVERSKIIDIQAFNANGNIFCFDDTRGMIVNKVYYVSYIIGECDPSGDINLEDACFKIISKPVRFIPYPTPDAGASKEVCGLFTQFDAVPSLGVGTWAMMTGPGNAIFTSDLPGSNLSVDQYGTYTFRWTENNGGCIENDDVTITFHGSPVWSNVTFECDDVAENYRMTFELNGGDQATWEALAASGWNAISLGGNVYQTPWIPTGNSVSISINDVYDCQPINLDTSFVCNCLTEPGVLDLEPHIFCVDGVANTIYSGGVEDPNDVHIFYLHDGTTTTIGSNVIVINKTGRFVFDPTTMVLNKIYYVTAIVGNDDGNGGIIMSDRCLGQTPGVPVVWYEDPEPRIVSLEDELTCKILVIELDGSGSIIKAGVGGLEYIWSTSNGSFETGADLSNNKVNITAPGTYTLSVVNDITGCTELTTYVIGVDRNPPTVDPGENKLLTCDITSVQLNGTKSDNGVGYTVVWTGPGINGSNATQLEPVVTVPGKYVLTVVNDETGCESEDEVEVTSNYTKPNPNIVQVGELTCATKEIVLDGSGSNSLNGIRSYGWSSRNGNIISSTSEDKITITSPGNYNLIVIDALTGCPDTTEIEVIEIDNTLELMQLAQQDLSCFGDRDGSIDITNIIGGFPSYEYSFNGGAFTNQTHFGSLGPGTYNLRVRDKNGCEMDTVVTIDEPVLVDIKAKEDQFVTYGDDVDLDSLWHELKGTTEDEPGTEIYWLDENGDRVDPLRENLQRSHYIYTVVVVNKNGCEARDLLNIYVKIERKIYIPNVFAPKTDGSLIKNQKVLVFGKPGIIEKVNIFQVYDRWGELVYENDEDIYFDDKGASMDGWDGTLNGSDMNPGVYVYYTEVEFKDLGEGVIVKKVFGDVTLLR